MKEKKRNLKDYIISFIFYLMVIIFSLIIFGKSATFFAILMTIMALVDLGYGLIKYYSQKTTENNVKSTIQKTQLLVTNEQNKPKPAASQTITPSYEKKEEKKETEITPTNDLVSEKENETIENTENTNLEESKKETSRKFNPEPFIKGNYLYKVYENVDIALSEKSNITPQFDKLLDFIFEPTNEYDSNAIKIMQDGNYLGYVYKGRLQQMIHDFNKRNEPYFALIDSIEPKITYTIAFYKDVTTLDSITTKLIKTNKADSLYEDEDKDLIQYRYEHIENTSIGECLILEYDYMEETYVVSNSYAEELGEINKRMSEKIHNLENDNYIYPYLHNVDENENGKMQCSIIIYYREK